MREIFFEEKLGETRRNSEGCEPHGQRWGASGGVRAARARMGVVGCEPHGERWEQWEGWEQWDSPRTPEGGLAGKGGRAARARMGAVGGTRRNSEGLGETRRD